MIKKMLVAIDGSEHAERALDLALEMAKTYAAEVQIVSVVSPVKSVIPRFTPAAPPSQFYNFFIKYIEDRLKTVLSEALKKAREENPTVKILTKLLNGNPAQEIVQTAKDENVDIIIIGSRGLGGIDELLLGSVSNKIADTATCPVLIVK